MTDLWLPILKKLRLNRAEQAAIKRYKQNPGGRSFLPVADILRSHKKIDESIELLMRGVERHPSFSVARVILARELLNKGLVAQSLETLEESPVSLDENILAQKLKFKLAILAGMENLAKSVLKHMQIHQMLDEESKKLGDLLLIASLAKAKDILISNLKSKGINPLIPSFEDFVQIPVAPQSTCTDKEEEKIDQDGYGFKQDEYLHKFHVVPLNEVFQGDVPENLNVGAKGGIELDSTTLGDIYSKQGHYGKALEIYRRLLRITPNNEFIQRKVKEMTRLEKEQKIEDLSVDPTVVDQMEAIEIINKQTEFFNSLLNELD